MAAREEERADNFRAALFDREGEPNRATGRLDERGEATAAAEAGEALTALITTGFFFGDFEGDDCRFGELLDLAGDGAGDRPRTLGDFFCTAARTRDKRPLTSALLLRALLADLLRETERTTGDFFATLRERDLLAWVTRDRLRATDGITDELIGEAQNSNCTPSFHQGPCIN